MVLITSILGSFKPFEITVFEAKISTIKSGVFFVNYVEERPLRPLQSPNNGRRKYSDGEGDKIKFIDLRFERW